MKVNNELVWLKNPSSMSIEQAASIDQVYIEQAATIDQVYIEQAATINQVYIDHNEIVKQTKSKYPITYRQYRIYPMGSVLTATC